MISTRIMVTPLRKRQILVFGLGWIAYASTYFLRKPLGVVKADLDTELSFSNTQLGWLDTALLLPYAAMQMLLGSLGDKFGARRTFGLCLMISGLSMMTFGSWSNYYIFILLLFINGAAQAQCWPNCMKALGAWYPDNVRNSVFGVFGTCAFSGGIMGTTLAVYLQTAYGWRSAFFTPSIIVFVLGLLVILLYQQPSEVNIDVPGKASSSPNNSGQKTGETLSWIQLWKIPMLAEVAVALFCLKVVRYSMYMWLPMYLLNQLHYSKAQAGMFSTIFEIGGVLGSATIGFIIDKLFGGRALVGSGVSVLFSTAALLLFTLTASWGLAINVSLLFLAGAFNCGPDIILGGSVPAELGETDGRNASASTVGLVNGFGSVGTFLEGPIIGFVSTLYGWSGMFYLMVGLSLTGTLSTFRAIQIQNRIMKQEQQKIPEAEPLNLESV